MPSFADRLQHAWSAFFNKDPTHISYDVGYSSSTRPDRPRLKYGNERSIVTAIYNRIAVDAAAIDMEHVKVDENGMYTETVKSGLNNCLTLEANEDQTADAFMQDAVLSMFDEGCVALVPTHTDLSPKDGNSYDIDEMRVGKITQWYPKHVKVLVYNEDTGQKQEVVLPKKMVAIIENPFYAVMNEPNSTLQRLIRTLNKIDVINEQNSSGKLDLIIQLPYTIKSDMRKAQAEKRRKEIEAQLTGTKYGIAYTDGTEKITQLNRPIENQLWQQVQDLQKMLYGQLGLSEEVFNGLADEKTMLNYFNRTIDPILSAFAVEMQRKFLSKNARTRGQAIRYFRDPFRLVTLLDLANAADPLNRNEILSSNELRAIIGYKPVNTPRADELINKNMPVDQIMGEEIQNPDEMVADSTPPTADGLPDDPQELQALIDELKQIEIEAGGSP